MRKTRRPGQDGGRVAVVAAIVMVLAGLVIAGAALLWRSGPPQPDDVGSPQAQHSGPVLEAATPTSIAIPAIGVRSSIIKVGLDADGSVQSPPLDRPQLAGWYDRGPTPGQRGPAVILGHVDNFKGPAVFFKLGELKPGSTVEVTRQDGKVAVFKTEGIERVSKDNFPTKKVYGDLDYAGLRLITCGGGFDKAKRSYTDNIIVYAYQVAVR